MAGSRKKVLGVAQIRFCATPVCKFKYYSVFQVAGGPQQMANPSAWIAALAAQGGSRLVTLLSFFSKT